VSDKFDVSIIGKIDLAEAEKIAKEDVLFFTENDIMEGLEDFELVPIKPGKDLQGVQDKILESDHYDDLPELTLESEVDFDPDLVLEKPVEEDGLLPDDLEGDISEIVRILEDDYNADDGVNALSDELIESKIIDITNDIIILDDKDKLHELTSEFPEKSDHLVKLLSYLDGLFEKLPEDVIRKFAESEYFDLYSKTLKDMGL